MSPMQLHSESETSYKVCKAVQLLLIYAVSSSYGYRGVGKLTTQKHVSKAKNTHPGKTFHNLYCEAKLPLSTRGGLLEIDGGHLLQNNESQSAKTSNHQKYKRAGRESATAKFVPKTQIIKNRMWVFESCH